MSLGQHVGPYLGHLQTFYYHNKWDSTDAGNVSNNLNLNWILDISHLMCRRSVCPKCDRQ